MSKSWKVTSSEINGCFLPMESTVSDNSEQKTDEKQPQKQKKVSMKAEIFFLLKTGIVPF